MPFDPPAPQPSPGERWRIEQQERRLREEAQLEEAERLEAERRAAQRWWNGLSEKERAERIREQAAESASKREAAKEAATDRDALVNGRLALIARLEEMPNEVERLVTAIVEFSSFLSWQAQGDDLRALCPELLPLQRAAGPAAKWFAERAREEGVPSEMLIPILESKDRLFGRGARLEVIRREKAWVFPGGAILVGKCKDAYVLESGEAVVHEDERETQPAVLGQPAYLRMGDLLPLSRIDDQR